MKLILAIIQEADVKNLLSKLIDKGYKATKLASTGGFLKAHNTTLLIGIEEERVEGALRVIKENCRKRTVMDPIPPYSIGSHGEYIHMDPVEYVVGGATVFVIDAIDYSKEMEE
ncbi:MAG: cyclic-di-AMP receptor [Clostridia bacterium]|jgi:uncharacterized protein YaaQ